MHRDLTDAQSARRQREADPAARQPHRRPRRAARRDGGRARGRRRRAITFESAMSQEAVLAYQSGWGNEFATEAVAGRAARRPELAAARRATGSTPSRSRAPRSPRRAPRIAARGRIASVPASCTSRSERMDDGRIVSRFDEVPASPNQMRWDPLPLPTAPTDFARRPRHDGGQRQSRGDERACDPHVRRQPLDARSLLLRRRRRAADRAAAGPPAHRHRARPARRRAAGDLRHSARPALSRRAAGRRGARLRVRELRRALPPAGPGRRSAATASPTRATS